MTEEVPQFDFVFLVVGVASNAVHTIVESKVLREDLAVERARALQRDRSEYPPKTYKVIKVGPDSVEQILF